MTRFIGRHILLGLFTVLPIGLTLYLLYWFAVKAESLLGGLIQWILPEQLYLPGMGVAISLVLVFVIGLLMRTYVARWLFSLGEKIIYRMPLIKSVYGALRDFFDFFSPTEKREFEQVVMVSLGNGNLQLIGFITRNNPPQGLSSAWNQDQVLVYLPMSFNIGGYTTLVPRSAVRAIDMDMEEAMRFALTAGITGVDIKTP